MHIKYADRLAHLKLQRRLAHQRDAGLASLLAPYRGAIPAQRRGEDGRWP